MGERRKEQKEKANRKRAGIIVAVGIGLRKSFNATARNYQANMTQPHAESFSSN
jgi:hypothetical protein